MDFDDNQHSQDGISKDDTSNSQLDGEGREKDRDRRGRGTRGTRFSDADNSRDRSREGRRNCRVYISNIPYDYRWQDLKDLFRRIVGSVEYVELFNDENGKPRGCGIVEFKDPDNVEKALEKMNRYEINGRELVVKEDHGENRDQYGRILRDSMGGSSGRVGVGDRPGDRGFSRREEDRISGSRSGNLMSNDFNMSYNTYGLSASFLESLGINGPLHNKIFVANLDYKVDSKKLKQVFKLAGKVQSVDLSVDKDGNSRGFAVVEYDHPVEAVQAISMFDRQMLYDRRMTVRLDRIPDKSESLKLPEGLGGIGIGLGPNGEPLRDVARNLPSLQQPPVQSHQPTITQNSNLGIGNIGLSNVVPATSSVSSVPSIASTNILGTAATSQGGLNLGSLSNSNLAVLRSVVGDLKNLAVGAALNNPLLTSTLNNLGPVTSNNEDQSQLGNNYSTGNNYPSGYSSSNFSTPQVQGGNYENSLRNQYNTGSQSGGNDYNSQPQDSFGGNGIGSGRKSDTIVIKNIPLSCTWQTLRDKFRDIGEVKFAEIRGNDVGVVRFFKEKDAELAIKLMDGSRMDGRTVSVTFF